MVHYSQLKSEEIEATVQRVVKETFLDMMQESGALQTLANLIKDAVVSELQRSIDFNSEVIQDLKQTIEQRDRKIGELERKVDDLEQYQRRQCVRIFGIEEEVGENTDKLVVELATNIGVELKVEDIDRSHRVGRTTSDGRPRPIIVKFCSYRKRSEVFFNKKRLKGSGMTLREDLTKVRHGLLREAIGKFGVSSVWTIDGVIFVKVGNVKHRITCAADLNF
ncbi:hypothetical protein ANN_00063 [Periplaneta americana]|uniref:Uncharacterized protein n=1 Tax=Periplaneta americana TaxID=6978 RepID=A0ABQ8TQT8_PERAM|nr:hypothetical protein ANN_00063 [Periplaneta americana]